MVNLLKNYSLFSKWSPEELGELSKIASERSLNIGEILFAEGSAAESLFLVKSGNLKIEKASGQDDEVVAQFGKGSYFGEMGMLGLDSSNVRSASAVATEASVVIQIRYQDLEKFLKDHSPLAADFYKTLAVALATRIRKTTQDLAGLKSLRLRHV